MVASTARPREPMLLFLVKAFSSVIWNLTIAGLLRDGHDRDGPLRAGGQAPIRSRGQQGKGDPERPADRIKASTGAAADLRARPTRELGWDSRWRRCGGPAPGPCYRSQAGP